MTSVNSIGAIGFGMGAVIVEPKGNNREASKFIGENYNEIVANTRKMGVSRESVEDLVADVYISIVENEEDGDGYDFNYMDDGITVAEFVYGRLKGYSKNIKYKKNGVQALKGHKSFKLDIDDDAYMMDKLARTMNGQAIKDNQTEEERRNKFIIIKDSGMEGLAFSSSGGDEDLDQMSSFQKAYAMAGNFDDLDEVEAELDIIEQIEYCLEFEGRTNLSIAGIFKNLEVFQDSKISKSLLEGIKELIEYHEDFSEAFQSVIEYSMNRKQKFDAIMMAY